MNDAPDIKHIIWKSFEKYDIEVSITAWFSHAMPPKMSLMDKL